MNGPLLGAEVRKGEACVGIDDGGDLDAREVVALRDHLRADEHGRARGAEALEGVLERTGASRRVRVEPDPLESRNPASKLGVKALRAGADPRELHRAALRTRGR